MTLDLTAPIPLNEYLQQLQQHYDAGNQPDRMNLDEYMQVLQNRADDFMAPRRTRGGALPLYPPLLEWFVLPTDEQFVDLPTPAPKPTPTPRRYRSSAELRALRDKLTQQRDAIMFDGPPDRAAANISGAPRWKKLDRNIAKVASLSRRIDALGYRIKAAEHREQHQN